MSTTQDLLEGSSARIRRSAERLDVLVKHKAPDIIIESERQILFKALFDFPVNTEAQLAIQQQKNDMYQEEQKFLHEHGFFDEVFGKLGEK